MKRFLLITLMLLFSPGVSFGFNSQNFNTEHDEIMYNNCMKIQNYPTAAEYAKEGSEAQKEAQKLAAKTSRSIPSELPSQSLDQDVGRKLKGLKKAAAIALLGNPDFEGPYYIKFGLKETLYFDNRGIVTNVNGFTDKSNFPNVITPEMISKAEAKGKEDFLKQEEKRKFEEEENNRVKLQKALEMKEKRNESISSEKETKKWFLAKIKEKKGKKELATVNKEASEVLYEVISRYNSGVNVIQGLEIIGNAQVNLDRCSRNYEGVSPLIEHYQNLLHFLSFPISLQQNIIKQDPIRNYELDIFFEKIMRDNQWFSPTNQEKSASLFGNKIVDKASSEDDSGVPFFLKLTTDMVGEELDYIRGMLK